MTFVHYTSFWEKCKGVEGCSNIEDNRYRRVGPELVLDGWKDLLVKSWSLC